MKFKALLGLICFIMIACEDENVEVKLPNQKGEFWIFILAGQSNMAGRAMVEPKDRFPHKNIFTLDKNNNWITAKEPLHFYEPSVAGLGPGLPFAKTLSSLYNDSIQIGLIPCAIGGSSIEHWLGDSLHRRVQLYSNLISRALTGTKAGVIKGILWHQGEANARSRKDHENYYSKLNTFFDRFRKEIKKGNLPVYVGELGEFLKENNYPYADSVNLVLKALSQQPDYYLIKSKDLTHFGDSLHFNSESMRILGKRFANKVYETQQ